MMSLTREIGHQNTKLDRGKGEIGDGSVSIHIAREKTPPPHRKKEHFTPRWKGIEPAMVPSSPLCDD